VHRSRLIDFACAAVTRRHIVAVYEEETHIIIGEFAVKGMEARILRPVVHHHKIAVIVTHFAVLEIVLLAFGQFLAGVVANRQLGIARGLATLSVGILKRLFHLFQFPCLFTASRGNLAQILDFIVNLLE
jgi:hypothetical protein